MADRKLVAQKITDQKLIASVEQIESRIFLIRGQKVMLDADLAELYGVGTKVFNQAVKRNAERFPEDLMFQLTAHEKTEVVTNCDHLAKLKFHQTCLTLSPNTVPSWRPACLTLPAR